MSDLFSRLAERAVALTTPQARPEPAGFHDRLGTDPGLGEATGEVTLTEFTTATDPAVSDRAPTPDAPTAAAPIESATPRTGQEQRAEPVAATEESRSGRASEPEADGPDRPENPATDLPREPRSVPPVELVVSEPPARRTTGSPESTSDSTTLLSAMPAEAPVAHARPVPAPPVWPAESGRSAQPTADDAPPVLIHIGRLDVRANLEAPPAPIATARAPKPEPELSLNAYLRGERTMP